MVIQKISFIDNLENINNIAVGVYSNGELSANAKILNEKLNDELVRNISKIKFSGKLFECCHFISSSDICNNVILIGLGDTDRVFSDFELEKLGASVYSAVNRFELCTVAIDKEDIKVDGDIKVQSLILFGMLLKSWKFDKYKTTKDEKTKLTQVQCVTHDIDKSENDFIDFKNIADAIFLTRSVVSEPGNVIYPESLSEIAQKELLPLGVGVEILNKNDMAVVGMNALLGVAQGSEKEPKLVILTWNGGTASEKPMAFVGKGVTFDSGGLSLKPSDSMEDMSNDMAGAGAVLGLMKAVALNKLPVNVVGVMALVENMPSGTAQRPGDIVKSMSGQTIEVLNTDAEGRLVLADALWYTQDRFSPKAIIDLATLTGAIIVALGHEFAGLFSNNDALVAAIQKSADVTGEKVWRLPMSDNFDKGIDSDVADIRNTAKPNVRGSSITAAHFLKRFVNGFPWAHIDIAGVESVSNDLFLCQNGATGFGVYLLYDLLCNNRYHISND